MKSLVKRGTLAVFLCMTLLLTLFGGVFGSGLTSVHTAEAAAPSPEFISVENGQFMFLGKEYRFVGTNNYYLHYKDNTMITAVLDDAVDAGFNVIRMWGFFDGFGMENQGNKAWMQPEANVYEKPDEAGADFVDCWDRLDYAVSQAALRDIKLIIVFTNYWSDFGGIEQYVNWANEANGTSLEKNDFYTDETCKAYYKNYVNHFLNRTNRYNGRVYKDDPTIFAWELMNEPRNQYGDPAIVTEWAREMSAYVKSIDSNHLVALGDEGTFDGRDNWAYEGNGDGMYNGTEGVDFEAVLALPDIDFGTYHLYPEGWGANDCAMEWGEKWIKDHISVGKQLNKPVILEEFGINVSGGKNRELIYNEWCDTVYTEGGAGLCFWMLASVDTGDGDANGNYPDYDGYRLLYESSVRTPEMQILIDYAKLFSNSAAQIEQEKVYMITPYLTSREDEDGNINYVEVDGDQTPVYLIQSKIVTSKEIEEVEVYTNRDKVGEMTYNASTGYYEYGLEMKYYKRGAYIDIDVVAKMTDGSELRSERTRIIRLLRFELVEKLVEDYSEAPTAETKGQLTAYSTPAYLATLRSIEWSDFNGGSIAVDCQVDMFSHWNEMKIQVNNIADELKESHGLSYDVFYEKDLLVPNPNKVPETAEAAATAPGFRNYAAIDPGWIKIGLWENDILLSDCEEVEIDGKTYVKQTVNISFTPTPNADLLILGVVFNNIQYDGKLYIDNFTLMERNMIGSPTDGYEERPKLPEEGGGCNSSIVLGTAGALGAVAVITAVIIAIGRKKAKNQ